MPRHSIRAVAGVVNMAGEQKECAQPVTVLNEEV